MRKNLTTLHTLLSRALLISSFFLSSTFVSADEANAPINLLSLPKVRGQGNYTYFARGSGDRDGEVFAPFTKAFYPGTPRAGWTNQGQGGRDGGRYDGDLRDYNGEPISIAKGFLTDDNLKTTVHGWTGAVEFLTTKWLYEGAFDILFDLGDSCQITAVEIIYTRSSGRNWATGNPQKVFTAQTLSDATSPSESDFTLFGQSIIPNGGNINAMTLTITSSAPMTARYVNLRPVVGVSEAKNGINVSGGILCEVRILGTPVSAPGRKQPITQH